MKASSWKAAGSAPGRVGICRGTPRGAPAGYKMCRTLAPTREMLTGLPSAEFELRYAALLAELDAAEVWREIHELAGPGVEPIILCFEHDPRCCHRSQVASWFQRELGEVVLEHETAAQLALL